jgi:hypothetical protein
MNFKKHAISIAMLVMFATSALAQFPNQHPDGVPMPAQIQQGGPVAVGQMQAQKDDAGKVSIIQAPPLVEAKTSVAFGDYAGAIVMWMLPILLPVIAAFATDLYVKMRARLGLQTSDAQRAKFQEIVENGVALGAHDAKASLSGKLTFEVKDQIMASAVEYTKAHAAETLNGIGIDPNSPEAVEAIRARAAKMLADLDAAATAVAAGTQATPPSPLAPAVVKTS